MPASLADLEQAFKAFADSLVGNYPAALRGKRLQPKVVNDPIWRTISFKPIEVGLIDSPLIQRLRRIRQLGVVHWVYPGATHSRFEHSLGAVHLVSSLIASINKETDFIKPDLANVLRLTALCHDVGHGVMSHVSQNFLAREVDFESLVVSFAETYGVEGPALSEIAAYYMLGSSGFRRLFDAARSAADHPPLPRNAIDLMREAIIGKPISDELPLLHELISGPFDADKLDYMNRDAQMSGVPVVTDIPRITHKVRAVNLSLSELPEAIAARVRGDLPAYTFTGIAYAGGRTLDELMLGRTLLFDKIYRHQKVRSAEAMVSSLLKLLGKIWAPVGALPVSYLLEDEDLTRLDRAELLDRAPPRLRGRLGLVETAVDLSGRLRDRRLFVRAFAFGTHMPLDPYRGAVWQRTGLERLCKDGRDPVKGLSLKKRLVRETVGVMRVLGARRLMGGFRQNRIEWYISISPPEIARRNEIMRAYLITEGPKPKLVRFKDESAEARGWSDAYLQTNDIGYVFCPAEISPYVHLAAQTVFSKDYGVRITASMDEYAKVVPGTLDRHRRRLQDRGYYARCPWHLRPLPSRLSRGDMHGKIEKILSVINRFSPVARGEESAINVSEEHVRDWLRQFEVDDLVDAALRVLERIRFIGRAESAAALRGFLAANPEFSNSIVCPLGEPKDSGSISAYWAPDVREFDLKTGFVGDALGSGRPIILVDDFIGSGWQSVLILETLLDRKPTYDLDEERHLKLSDKDVAKLRNIPVAAVYSAGLDKGVTELEARCAELELRMKAHVQIPQNELPTIRNVDYFKDSRQQQSFVLRCSKIGEQLLATDGRRSRAWRGERSLGYGNHGLLLLFPFNVPAQTLTCLWSEGQYQGIPWLPLLPRRKKK